MSQSGEEKKPKTAQNRKARCQETRPEIKPTPTYVQHLMDGRAGCADNKRLCTSQPTARLGTGRRAPQPRSAAHRMAHRPPHDTPQHIRSIPHGAIAASDVLPSARVSAAELK